MQKIFVGTIGLCFLVLAPLPSVFAEHIFDNSQAFGQYLDIAQLTSPKYTLEVGDASYDVYYGFHGSLEIDVEKINENLPIVSSMGINSERKSLEIDFSEVPQDSVFWVRIPFEVMTAENERHQLFIDGIETKYDYTKFPSDYAIGMIIPKDSEHVEVVGTTVIPEFSVFSVAVLGLSVLGMTLFLRHRLFANIGYNHARN